MKLVLASQEFTTPDIAQAVAELVNEPLKTLNVAVINEAYVGIGAGHHESCMYYPPHLYQFRFNKAPFRQRQLSQIKQQQR